MTGSLAITFLGTGTSVGIPQIGCTCPACTSADPRDSRSRSGVIVESREASIIVDTPPEFRISCLKYGIARADAVVITHTHMDHVAGFDDVRRFNTINGAKPMNCYGAKDTLEGLKRIFPYISDKPNTNGLYRPMIRFRPVERAFRIKDIKVTPVPVDHGPRTNGYVFESAGVRLAYIPDCHDIPQNSMVKLRNLDLLVLDCLREERPHPTHMTLSLSLAAAKRIGAKKTLFTHMCHSVVHEPFERKLPEGIRLAYDGLKVELPF